MRAKLLALIPEDKREQLAQILSDISSVVTGVTRDGRFENAEKAIRALQKVGDLNDATICGFARNAQLPEVIVGIAVLASSKIDVVKDILTGDRNDAVLVPCKAINLRWETVEQILRNRQRQKTLSQQIIDLAKNDYRRLSVETAQKTLRFLQVRATSSNRRLAAAISARRYSGITTANSTCGRASAQVAFIVGDDAWADGPVFSF